MESAREARRRKIAERGSERLAFITGQSQSLASSSSFGSPRPPILQPQQQQEENPRSAAATATTTSDVLRHVDAAGMEAHEHQPIDQTFSAAEQDDKTELFPEHDADREVSGPETSSEFVKCKMGKKFFKGGMRKEAEANTEQDGKIAEQSNPIVHTSSDQVVDRSPCINLPMSHQLWTSKQISHAISASENIRLLCAISIALLVVMSSRGYSWGGKILGRMLDFRPLCLVLLTDITAIIAHLFVSQKSPSKDGDEARGTRQVESSLANNIGDMLEIGLLFQKALNAAFMDCCICAVFMISGLLV